MQYYSLKNKHLKKSFREATLLGQSPDGGLFFPEYTPKWNQNFIAELRTTPLLDLSFEIMKEYVGDDIKNEELKSILADTLSFDLPLYKLSSDTYILELFHGPTMAFKDVGARFLSRCLGYFSKDIDKEIIVLVATSGDTGGAVSTSFADVQGAQVVILYPSGKVSPLQEKQLSSSSSNVFTLEIDGTFDDCQHLVKTAFVDQELKEKLYLTSANSINIARWLPQQLYYVAAVQQWMQHENSVPTFCVPSGNAGNICAGILARQSGLAIKHFIAACNVNDVITNYFESGGIYKSKQAVATLSNAMDIGSPNNFIRIIKLFEQDFNALQNCVNSFRVNDRETIKTIQQVYEKYAYILDPHTAVGIHALNQYRKKKPNLKSIVVGTAHPIKFASTVEKAIHTPLEIDAKVEAILSKEKNTVLLDNTFDSFKLWLTQQF